MDGFKISYLTLFTPGGEKQYSVGGSYAEIKAIKTHDGQIAYFALMGAEDEVVQIVYSPAYAFDVVAE